MSSREAAIMSNRHAADSVDGRWSRLRNRHNETLREVGSLSCVGRVVSRWQLGFDRAGIAEYKRCVAIEREPAPTADN
jgi:hypothetical protein